MYERETENLTNAANDKSDELANFNSAFNQLGFNGMATAKEVASLTNKAKGGLLGFALGICIVLGLSNFVTLPFLILWISSGSLAGAAIGNLVTPESLEEKRTRLIEEKKSCLESLQKFQEETDFKNPAVSMELDQLQNQLNSIQNELEIIGIALNAPILSKMKDNLPEEKYETLSNRLLNPSINQNVPPAFSKILDTGEPLKAGDTLEDEQPQSSMLPAAQYSERDQRDSALDEELEELRRQLKDN